MDSWFTMPATVAKLAQHLGLNHWAVSLSHSRENAVAMVVANIPEKKNPVSPRNTGVLAMGFIMAKNPMKTDSA